MDMDTVEFLNYAEKGHLKELKTLHREKNIDVNVYWCRALILAVENGHIPIVEYLIDQGADIETEKFTLIHHCVCKNNFKMVQFLVSKGVSLQGLYQTTLITSASHGYMDILKYSVENGGSINDALFWGAVYGQLQVVEYAVEQGAVVHGSGGEKALMYSCFGGHLPVVKYLVEKGVDIHKLDETALKWAISAKHLDIANFLLQHGADIHAGNEYVLLWAILDKNVNTIKFLLKHGADPSRLSTEYRDKLQILDI